MIFESIMILILLVFLVVIASAVHRIEASLGFILQQVMTLIRYKEKIEKEREKDGQET